MAALCPCDTGDGRERGSARGQMQKFAAGKFHYDLPNFPVISLDHLVGAGKQRRRHGETEHPRGFGVNNQVELGGLHDR